jgi:Protein of unknown function (DUF1524)
MGTRARARLGGVAALALLAAVGGCSSSTVPLVAASSQTASSQTASSSSLARGAPGPSVSARGTGETVPAASTSRSAAAAASAPSSGTALAQARRLEVKGRAPMTGYRRADFGDAWRDVDGNGCDTRNDILARDLVDVRVTSDCKVRTGLLHDPYSGATIHFVRGVGTSDAVQIDHVVALGDAWQKGAQQWSASKRLAFANDPLNLLAVSGPVNQEKGDADAATWLPPSKGYRCSYVARQVAVKTAYGLWVTAAEKAAILRVLSSCPAMRAVSR